MVQFLLLVSLSACGVTHEYKKPDAAFPEGYRGGSTSAKGIQPESSIALLPYSSFFADKTLCALIDSAVTNNIDLQVALKNIDYARQTLNSSRLGLLPTLNVGVQTTRTHPSDNGAKTNVEDYTASATSSWEADIWGKIRSRNHSALAAYLKTQEAAKAVRTRLVADIASGYYTLLMLDVQLESSRKNLALADTTFKMIGLQYDAGQVTALAVQQQEALRQSIAGSLPAIEQKIAVQENALSILCGRMPAAIKRDRALFTIKVADELPSGIPAALLQNRPDVRAAELAVRGAHADMGEAKAALYPSLTVTAAGGVEAFRTSQWFTLPGSIFGLLQGAVVQPVFQRGQLKAKYAQSKIKREQTELEFKQSLLKAVAEVSDALVQLDKVKLQETIAEQRVATLQKAVSDSGMLFRSGMATYLEVIVAQTNALQAELALADIRRQHLSAMSELYRSLGGGWR
ncbi:MAG: efflux transporter outer membrane subunit [Chlorobiaceae bacterium]|nr:efflux transporter outer membrane subunit [Chlorobiaceae bacterium]